VSDFRKNLEELIVRSDVRSVKVFAGKLGLGRTVISRLRSGAREPTPPQLRAIAEFAGFLSADDLLRPHNEFLEILTKGHGPNGSPLHTLAVLQRNVPRCAELLADYKGQYILYAPSSRENTVVASLFEITGVSQHGMTVRLVNPYNGHDGDYLAFEYAGFMVPASEYLYVFAEQVTENYEVTTLIFHAPPLRPVRVLEGIWSGIGVKRNRKFISASPAVAIWAQKPIADWREELGGRLGYLPIGRAGELVRQKMKRNGILVLSDDQ
jgi:hypothetical protein